MASHPCHPAHLPPSPSSSHHSSSPFPRCTATTLLPNPCPPFLLGIHVTTGEVVTSVECGHTIGWKLADVTGVSLSTCACMQSPVEPPAISIAGAPFSRSALHAEGRNRHREMVHASSKPQFSKAVRSERSPCISLSSSLHRSPIRFASIRDAPLPYRHKNHSSHLLLVHIDVRTMSAFRWPVHFISSHGISLRSRSSLSHCSS